MKFLYPFIYFYLFFTNKNVRKGFFINLKNNLIHLNDISDAFLVILPFLISLFFPLLFIYLSSDFLLSLYSKDDMIVSESTNNLFLNEYDIYSGLILNVIYFAFFVLSSYFCYYVYRRFVIGEYY